VSAVFKPRSRILLVDARSLNSDLAVCPGNTVRFAGHDAVSPGFSMCACCLGEDGLRLSDRSTWARETSFFGAKDTAT